MELADHSNIEEEDDEHEKELFNFLIQEDLFLTDVSLGHNKFRDTLGSLTKFSVTSFCAFLDLR